MRAFTLDPVADPRWRGLVERAPGGSVFHHPHWIGLLRSTYGYPVTACCVGSEGGHVEAGLPVADVSSRLTGRRLVALPFSDLCPPLVAGDAPPGAAAAQAQALDGLRRRRAAPLEVRGAGEVLCEAASGERFHHHLLRLGPDVRHVERRFAKAQAGRGVRRALREGLRGTVRRDGDALEAFYRLHVATRRRLGVPTQPRRFVLGFEALFREDLGFVLLIHHRDQPVAAAVFLTFGDVLTYKYGASDDRFLRWRPNNLLFREAIAWGCEHGMRTLDFGRTDRGQEGLRAFKLAWGAEEHELRYRHIGEASHRARSERGQRLLGAVIRRGPPLAGRAIGEVLYRHAA